MHTFLSIVIPRFKETPKDIFPLLSSISNQVGIDFDDLEILVCNDGGGAGELPEQFLENFSNLSIKQINMQENRGPGIARQTGIDNATGQYLMFCDADDILHNVGVLGAMMQEAEKYAPDILATSWLEEVLVGGEYRYVTHSHENTWMHGKFLRRQYLLQNNIRHHEQLRVHEDSYLLSLTSAFTNRSRYMDITSYVWKYGPNSITRRNNAIYTYDSMPTFIYACCEAHKVIEKKIPELMEQLTTQLVLYCYFNFHLPHWTEEKRSIYLHEAENALVKNIKPQVQYLESVSAEEFAQIYSKERNRSFAGQVEMETFGDWCRRIGLSEAAGR